MEYQNCITGIMFLLCMLEDIASRRISTRNLLIYMVLVFAGRPENMLAGAVPGICCLLLSLISRQGLGYGDSLLILISGISLGAEQEMLLLMSAFFLAGIWSVISLVRKQAECSSEMPFLPFLLTGWLLSTGMWTVR